MEQLQVRQTAKTGTTGVHHPHLQHQQQQQGKARLRHFFWHLLQMILAMIAGMGLYMLFRQGLAPASYTAAIVVYPLVGYWMMVAFMTLPMIALMRYHRHGWRHCLEMTAAMLAPLALLSVFVQMDLLAFKALHHVGDVVMILSMALLMLYRRAEYA